MKKCKWCGIIKPLDDFYKCPTMKDGHFNKCKECYAKDSKLAYDRNRQNPEWREKEKMRHSEKYRRLNYREKPYNKEKSRDAVYRNNERYPEKYKARCATRMVIPPMGMVKHHWSYRKEHYRDLIFISADEHIYAHRYLVYDPERLQYRTISGILLDTKEAHNEYIKNIF